MIQPSLYPEPATVASPLCMYQPCSRKGRAVLGPVERRTADCENRSVECVTCGVTGWQSRNLTVKGKA